MKSIIILFWFSLIALGCNGRPCANHPNGHEDAGVRIHGLTHIEDRVFHGNYWHQEICIKGYEFIVVGTNITVPKIIGMTQFFNEHGPAKCGPTKEMNNGLSKER